MQLIKNFIARYWSTAARQKFAGKRQLWWIDNKMGGYDGYELEPGGRLHLLNWDLFTGIKWEMRPEGLYTEILYRKNGQVLKKTAPILSLTERQMVLKTVTPDNEFIDTYEKITFGTIADKVYGHYTNGDSYVQVIPVDEYAFQLVFSEGEGEVVKCYGRLESKTEILMFSLKNEDLVLQHNMRGKVEELKVGDRTYTRPVFT